MGGADTTEFDFRRYNCDSQLTEYSAGNVHLHVVVCVVQKKHTRRGQQN